MLMQKPVLPLSLLIPIMVFKVRKEFDYLAHPQ